MKRFLAVLATIAALGGGYQATEYYQPLGFGGMGRDFGKLGAQNKAKSSGGGGGETGFVLRTDGSFVLRTDGSKICRAGGC